MAHLSITPSDSAEGGRRLVYGRWTAQGRESAIDLGAHCADPFLLRTLEVMCLLLLLCRGDNKLPGVSVCRPFKGMSTTHGILKTGSRM